MKYPSIFRHLKKTLLNSGYRVILTDRFARRHGGLARGSKGYILPDDLTIFINKTIGVNDRVVTLVHELLHEIYPEWQEQRVDRASKRIFNHLTVPQLGFLQFFVMLPTEIKAMLKSNQLSPTC
jgi:O-phosphoseryl-tRNA(Cys) synthetase